MVEIPESYLIVFFGAVFIPLFIFLMKMIMEQGNTKSRIEILGTSLEESKELFNKVFENTTDIKLIKQRIGQMENEMKHVLRKTRDNRFDERDSAYFPDGDMADHGTG
jgi:ABC-type multidrug transport system fused ATPase/permease subunit